MLTITWDNPNTIKHDYTRVYRSTSKTGEYELIDTLPPTTLKYDDKSPVPINRVYWYQIIFINEKGENAESVPFAMGYFPGGTGPGPQELLRGNWEMGYFGEVDPGSLPSATAIWDGFKNGASSTNWLMEPDMWYKCVAQGRIIYIPNRLLYNQYHTNSVGLLKFIPKLDEASDVINEVTHNGYFFSARPPYATSRRRNTSGEDDPLTDTEGVLYSELAMVSAVFQSAGQTRIGDPFKVNDVEWKGTINITYFTSTHTPNSPNPMCKAYDNPPRYLIPTATSQNGVMQPILELLFE